MRYLHATVLASLGALALCLPACCLPLGPTRACPAAAGAEDAMATAIPLAPDVGARLAQWAPVELGLDDAALTAQERAVLRPLLEAARIAGDLARRQIDARLPVLRARLVERPGYEQALALFDIAGGPWDPLDQTPFVFEVRRKPGGEWYPEDMSQEEFERHLAEHPGDREAFSSYFTVLERGPDGGLVAVPYRQVYAAEIGQMAALLEQAASLAQSPSLKDYLAKRAAALRSDDYFEADGAWLRLGSDGERFADGRLEITFGPYEVYDDQLLNYKAIFAAYVAVRDPDASAKLAAIGRLMAELDANLPLAAELRGGGPRGLDSPIAVVDNLYCGGCAGVQAIAFNLPNDERVRAAFGSKQVLMRNLIDAKFTRILTPIAQRVISADQLPLVDREAFFTDILVHEVSHGLGPGLITRPDGSSSDVNKELKDLYPAIEEAKADIGGLHSIAFLEERGIYPPGTAERVYVTFLAGSFRSVRFGAEEAHAKAVVASFNYLWDHGGYVHDRASGRFRVDLDVMPCAVRDLAALLLQLEAKGDYAGAQSFLATLGGVRPEMRALIDGFHDIPVDIAPRYPIVERMVSW